ncbi:GNAT family N-acetyltransferase [Paeniglutamicibacter sp. MACA_103]|uniref:GNAT family N-acetyltransferase n=1 Tax=Paeniglutamicibacter sp. MACA_103 TaxID=3377337 RepID=UPI003896112B
MRRDWIRPEHVPAWAGLTNRLAVADATEEFYEVEDLAEELEEPGVDPERDTLGLWDNDRMIGFGQLRLGEQLRDGRGRVSIGGGVAPEYRRLGHGAAIMDTLESRAAEKMAERHPGIDFTIDIWGNAPGHSAGAMALARGYEAARYFQDMSVKPAGFQPRGRPAAGPGDARLVAYSPDLSEPVRVLDNEAFADHWGSTPKSVEEWAAVTSARSFRSEYSRVLLETGAGTTPAMVLCYVLAAEWVPGELYVSRVGTARAARGRGYAAWALSATVQSAFDAGITKVDLTVDAQSPTRAAGLYRLLGFELVRQGTVYRKTVQAR